MANAAQVYNTGGTTSTIDGTGSNQLSDFHYKKSAIITARKKAYFGQLADTTNMPKHFGKTVKQYVYLHILNDANINSQGITAGGVATTVNSVTITLLRSAAELPIYAEGEGATAALALTAAKNAAVDYFKNNNMFTTSYAVSKGNAITAGWTVTEGTAVPAGGNLYGDSKDIGNMVNKMPLLNEQGGEVNRVGVTRKQISGTLERYGIYDSYTDESLAFDSDPQLLMHINREMVNAAHEVTEDLLQIDLLNGAGVVRYTGNATSVSTIIGEGAGLSAITYNDLMRLDITLTNNLTPRDTKVISGTRLVDTRTIPAARIMYIGSELIPTFKNMVDNHGNPVFIPLHQYNAAVKPIVGEIGSADMFRIVVVPEMANWSGVGATVVANAGYRETGGKYDVFPALVVGSESFSTIGFQMNGKNAKFQIIHKKPGADSADMLNPYGTKGFMSINFFYGILITRPERIAVIKCVAEW